MIEAEWVADDKPEEMLALRRGRATNRKYRLYAVACARDELTRAQNGEEMFNFGDPLHAHSELLYWDVDHGYEAAIRSAEAHADESTTQMSHSRWLVAWPPEGEDVAFATLGYDPDGLVAITPERVAATIGRYRTHPARYLRDIFGNPFRPVTSDPEWRTSTVMALAQQMYESRDFGAMPILADALQDVGCDSDDILTHCRDPHQVHVRGCWVVDLVLGKE
ncbi:hypothetical protein [Gemmata sp.]|uniref:hypothetical protein n=1 Tax=Gemmata sp. TaxID=1914242 RepID=UPI003F705E15